MTAVKLLTPQEVRITTASVQVQTLTLNNKQMTLSVFRQLLREPIMEVADTASEIIMKELGVTRVKAIAGAKDYSLAGTPWGTVNYFWKGCDPWDRIVPPDHLHVVWEKKELLRRSCVTERPDDWHVSLSSRDWDELNWWDSLPGQYTQRKWYERYLELIALPQLFIAV